MLADVSSSSDKPTRKPRKLHIELEENNLAPLPNNTINKRKKSFTQSEKDRFYKPVKKQPKKRIIEICSLDEALQECEEKLNHDKQEL